MRASFESATEQVRANTRAALVDRDPEAVHQLRVGVRRLRVALRLFEKSLGPAHAERLAPELRWIFGRLGAVRDYDVLLESLDGLYPEPPRALEPLRAELTRARAKASRAVLRDLAGARYVALIRALRRLSIELAAREDSSPRARNWSRRRIERRLDAVVAHRDALSGDDPEALHVLRKQLKKLRYTVELVGVLWPDKRTKRYLRRLSTLQDTLGPINDAAVGGALLARAATRLERAPARVARDGQRALAARASAELPALARAFTRLEREEPFWR